MSDESERALADAINRLAAALERIAGPFGGIQHHGIPSPSIANNRCINCGGFHGALQCPRLQPWSGISASNNERVQS